MTTIDLLISSEVETQFSHLRKDFPSQGYIIRDLRIVDTEQMVTQLENRLLLKGISVIILVTGPSIHCPTASKVATHTKVNTRYHGVEALLRQNDSPFLQSFAGTSSETYIFVIPGLRRVMERLMTILEELHNPGNTKRPPPKPSIVNDFEDEQETVVESVSVRQKYDAQTNINNPTVGSGWQKGLQALGAKISNDVWTKIPESLKNIPLTKNIIERAGQQRTAILPSGKNCLLIGFPDLLRPSSKVLLIGEGEPHAEVIALHRYPKKVGLLSSSGCGWLPSVDSNTDRFCIEATKEASPNGGQPFAINGNVVYLERKNTIYSWDGKQEAAIGTTKQAISSLMLDWSQK